MSVGVKLGSKIAPLDREIFLETVEGKSPAVERREAYTRIVRRERMPVDIRMRPAYHRGCYSLFAVPHKTRGSKQ